MAVVINIGLAGQSTSTSRWGELKFDAKGRCEVDDKIAQEIQAANFKGWQVIGLEQQYEEKPIAATQEEIEKEKLSEEELAQIALVERVRECSTTD